jgi:hypothetical protein
VTQVIWPLSAVDPRQLVMMLRRLGFWSTLAMLATPRVQEAEASLSRASMNITY